jgi:hypothetical protein
LESESASRSAFGSAWAFGSASAFGSESAGATSDTASGAAGATNVVAHEVVGEADQLVREIAGPDDVLVLQPGVVVEDVAPDQHPLRVLQLEQILDDVVAGLPLERLLEVVATISMSDGIRFWIEGSPPPNIAFSPLASR